MTNDAHINHFEIREKLAEGNVGAVNVNTEVERHLPSTYRDSCLELITSLAALLEGDVREAFLLYKREHSSVALLRLAEYYNAGYRAGAVASTLDKLRFDPGRRG